MVGVHYGSSCLVVEGFGKYPVRRAVGNRVTNPLEAMGEMAPGLGMTVNEVDEVLGVADNDECRRGPVYIIFKGAEDVGTNGR